MDGTHRTHRGKQKFTQDFCGETRRNRPLGVEGGIILKTNFYKIRWDSMDWIHGAQDWDKWQAVINMIMNLQVP